MANIYISMADRFSPVLNGIRSSMQGFNAELVATKSNAKAYARSLNELVGEQTDLKVKIAAANKALAEAKKAFKEAGTEANHENLAEAQKKYDQLKEELNEVNEKAVLTRKSLKEMNEDIRKMTDGSFISMSSSSILSSLSSVGLFNQLGGAAAKLGSNFLTRGMTADEGSMISSMLSGIASGAAMGSLAGPIGTAIGSAVGATAGIIEGATSVANSRNDAFKAYYNDLFDELESAMGEMVTGGTTIASGRETIALSYRTLLGDTKAANDVLSDIKAFADRTPFEYDTLSNLGKTMVSYGYSPDSIIGVLSAIGGAGAAVGASGTEMQTIADVIGRASAGSLSAEQLNRLLYLGINPYSILAEQYNSGNGTFIGEAEMRSMISKKSVTGEWAAEALLDYFSVNFSASLAEFSQSFTGLSSTMEDWQAELQNYMGEGYNAKRSEGMRQQLAWYERHGEALGEAYGIIGESRAFAENYSERLKSAATAWVVSGQESMLFDAQPEIVSMLQDSRRAFSAAQESYMTGSDFDKAKAGITMQTLLEEAEGIATAFYDGSQLAKTEAEAAERLAASLNAAADAADAWVASYDTAQAKTVGRPWEDKVVDWIESIGRFGLKYATFAQPGSYAYGLERVPYNGFPAVLHEGERVLTAGEARSRSSTSITISKLADEIIVREDADIDRIAAALAAKLASAAAIM